MAENHDRAALDPLNTKFEAPTSEWIARKIKKLLLFI